MMTPNTTNSPTCRIQLGWLALILSCGPFQTHALSPPSRALIKPATEKICGSSRRDCLVGLGSVGGLLAITTEPAHAARGAFELDSEYYIRDFLGGNKKEGNILPSKPPAMPPPRKLEGPLLPLLLDNSYSQSCIPVQALVQQVCSKQSVDSASVVATSIAQKAKDYRSKAARSFSSRAQWNIEDVSDQYYFDLSAYALWKTAADYLPNYTDRDIFARNVGRRLYEKMAPSLGNQSATSKGSIVASEPEVKALLNAFKDSKFFKGYKIGRDQAAGNQQEDTVFDQLDDESLQIGLSVDCLVSVYEPSTLGASLQITGEQSRFAPDFVGATLAAFWESKGIKCSWEIFFVDQEYRPNPKDYYPNEKLIQFSLQLP